MKVYEYTMIVTVMAANTIVFTAQSHRMSFKSTCNDVVPIVIADDSLEW